MSVEKVYDASEYLRASCVVEDRVHQSKQASDAFFAVAARALIFVLTVYTTLRFYARQARYAVERRVLFGDSSPQHVRRDVSRLSKIPRHVAFVLNLTPATPRGGGGLDGLLNALGQVTSWSLGAGAQQLTVYERTGTLQDVSLASVRDAIVAMLSQQFGSENVPLFFLRSGTVSIVGGGGNGGSKSSDPPSLTITLTSERDGRPFMARLAREFASEVAKGTLNPDEITVPYVHEQLRQRVGEEPDLLVTFGSRIDLDGFSPWHLRVTELFCLPDNSGVLHYLVFYRALQKFSTVKINLGA